MRPDLPVKEILNIYFCISRWADLFIWHFSQRCRDVLMTTFTDAHTHDTQGSTDRNSYLTVWRQLIPHPSMRPICCLTRASAGIIMTDLHNPAEKKTALWHINTKGVIMTWLSDANALSLSYFCHPRSLYLRGIAACGRCTHPLLSYVITG